MESIISIHKSVHGEETLRGRCQVRTRVFEKQRMEAQNAEKTISNRRENQDPRRGDESAALFIEKMKVAAKECKR